MSQMKAGAVAVACSLTLGCSDYGPDDDARRYRYESYYGYGYPHYEPFPHRYWGVPYYRHRVWREHHRRQHMQLSPPTRPPASGAVTTGGGTGAAPVIQQKREQSRSNSTAPARSPSKKRP